MLINIIGRQPKNSSANTSCFWTFCDQADIPDYDRGRAFSIMLVGHDRQFYFNGLKLKNLGLAELEVAVESRYLTFERTRVLFGKWEATKLTGVLPMNGDKSASACLESLIKK